MRSEFVKLRSVEGLSLWVRCSAVVAVSEVPDDTPVGRSGVCTRVEISAETFLDVRESPAEVLALLNGKAEVPGEVRSVVQKLKAAFDGLPCGLDRNLVWFAGEDRHVTTGELRTLVDWLVSYFDGKG